MGRPQGRLTARRGPALAQLSSSFGPLSMCRGGLLAEVHIPPPRTAAASFVPSAEEAIQVQYKLPGPACSLQLFPESVEVKIDPPLITAASFLPLLEGAIPVQDLVSAAVCSVQFNPESGDVQMPPLLTTAASALPSIESATLALLWQFCFATQRNQKRASYFNNCECAKECIR
jgi:hypothetical protein